MDKEQVRERRGRRRQAHKKDRFRRMGYLRAMRRANPLKGLPWHMVEQRLREEDRLLDIHKFPSGLYAQFGLERTIQRELNRHDRQKARRALQAVLKGDPRAVDQLEPPSHKPWTD